MARLAREIGAGCGRAALIQGITVVLVVPLFCLLILLPLALTMRTGLDPFWLALPAGVFLLILLGGGLAWMAWVVHRRRQHLDSVCQSLGLTGRLYQFMFRQYHGELEGREVAIYFYRGPTVEIDVTTSLQTRLAVTDSDTDTIFLAGLLNRQPLLLDDPEMEGLWVSALDKYWAGSLVATKGPPGLLRRLIQFPGAFTRRHVVLRPGAWRLTLFGSGRLLDLNFDVTAESMRAAVEDLLMLARLAETLPEPEERDIESAAEVLARRLRERNPYLLPALTLLLFGLLICVTVVVAAIVVYLASGT